MVPCEIAQSKYQNKTVISLQSKVRKHVPLFGVQDKTAALPVWLRWFRKE
jgi:hypothetical protein